MEVAAATNTRLLLDYDPTRNKPRGGLLLQGGPAGACTLIQPIHLGAGSRHYEPWPQALFKSTGSVSGIEPCSHGHSC